MKRFIVTMGTLLALGMTLVLNAAMFAPPSVAYAAPDPGNTAGGVLPSGILAVLNTVGDDTFAQADLGPMMPGPNGTQHYGPYASGSPDSGTCGNNWAEDTYDRHFTVHDNGDGTFTVVEQFKQGSFVTSAGASPGACDSSDGTPPGAIAAGVTGSMHGYLIVTVTGLQTSQDSSCIAGSPSAPCTTGGFLASHFAGASTTETYFFHYAAGDQGLIAHEWKNASCDRGGNQGDIASVAATPPFPPVSTCP
jgi:hypothetical protein